VQVLVDGADSIQGVVSQNAVAAYLAEKSVALMMARLAERSALAATLAQSSATGATTGGDDGVSGAVAFVSAGPTATASGPSSQPVPASFAAPMAQGGAPVDSNGSSPTTPSAMAATPISVPSGQPGGRPASAATATRSASSPLGSTEWASPPPLSGLPGLAQSPTPPTQIDLVRVEPRTFYNPSLDSQLHFVPGIAAILLLVVTIIVTALGLSREDEAGTLEQVLVTPMTPTTLVLGKTLPYALIGLVDLLLVIAAGAVVFDVPIRGRLWLLLLAGILYMLTTLGIGLLAGTLAKSQQQAFFNAAFFLLPAMILSGFLNPIESMPEWLQPVTAFDPVRHFVEILRAVLLKGSSLSDLAPSYVALAGMGIATFWLAGWALRRKLR
jgi:ABC transporter DrrB family efflux protein